MDKSWMNIFHRTKDPRYEFGVNEFLNFAYRGKEVSTKVPCPCKTCNNFRSHNKNTIYSHLMQKGIIVGYDKWTYHGECSDISDDSDDDISLDVGCEDNDGTSDDNLDEMLHNIGQSTWGDDWQNGGDDLQNDGDDCQSPCILDKELETLRRLLDESHEDLYIGCKSYTKFSFIVTILHLKTRSGWSIKSFDALLDIFKKALPSSALIPKNFYEAKKYIRDLGFRGEKIDACVNDCVLYRNEYASHTQCPNDECKEPRFCGDDLKVPRKVLRYFPLKPRLQRLFIDEQVSVDMRWHKEKRVDDDNIVRHPADSEAWKHLDRVFPSFADDPRNIRLGLATDGFNPFGSLSNSYSIWPVFVVPYNLPPWKCMKEAYMFMPLLIPGPKSPGINIDVYLQPLIDELKELWLGVEAYDAHGKEKFTLRAALLWTINDFPAYGMLSGWSVKGYNACPNCMNETTSDYLSHSKKICYMGHRRFLPSSNQWRKDKKNFDGTVDLRESVKPMSGNELLHDIDCTINTRKRKRGWKKKSVFFELPYWAELKLRHNIDIMHVVKNVTESLTATLFNIKGKTKDTLNSRKDLMEKGLKRSLHLQPRGDSYMMPMACYHLTKDEKRKITNFLKSLKFPDGFASNISRCIKGDEFQLSRMKFIVILVPKGIPGGRKESRGLSGKRKRHLKNDNFILEIDEYAGRIIGEDSQHFITKGGCLLRECAIFDGTTWKKQSRLLKRDIINKCMENSNYDSSCGVMLEAINRQLAFQHKNRQYKFHLYYQKFPTKDEAIRHPPNGIKAPEWVKLCERFASEEFQKISLRNQKNNSFNVIPPAVGTRSIARMVDEKRRSGQEVSAIDKFRIGHFSTKKNRMVNEKADEVLNDLLREEANSSFTPEEICLEKLGHIPGHIKGRSISKRETLATENLRYELELEREKSKALEVQVQQNKEELQRNKEELRQNKEALVEYQKDQDLKMKWMMQELARLSKLQSG